MFKIGDKVKVIAATQSHWDQNEFTEYIPIGTICVVRDIDYNEDGTVVCYGIQPLGTNELWYYLESELEKGHLEWVKDE